MERINIIKNGNRVAIQGVYSKKERNVSTASFRIGRDEKTSLIAVYAFNAILHRTEMENVTIQDGRSGTPEQLTPENWGDLTDGLNDSEGGGVAELKQQLSELQLEALTALRVHEGAGIKVTRESNEDITLSVTYNTEIFTVVPALPAVGDPNRVYLVPAPTPTPGNMLDVFIYVDDDWEQIDAISVDLSNYYTKDEIDTKFAYVNFIEAYRQTSINSNALNLSEAIGNYAINLTVATPNNIQLTRTRDLPVGYTQTLIFNNTKATGVGLGFMGHAGVILFKSWVGALTVSAGSRCEVSIYRAADGNYYLRAASDYSI